MGFAMTDQRPEQNRFIGILLRLGAASSFALMAAMIKLGYEAGIGTVDLIFYRFAFGLPPLLLWIAFSRNFTAWRTSRPSAHLTRTMIGLSAMVASFSALGYLPLAEATVISFAAPLFSVMLSALVLGEEVRRHRWTAVMLGLVGVAIVMQPGGTSLPMLGLGLALAGAFGVGCVNITIRQISRTEGSQTIVLWFTLSSMLLTGTLLPFFGGTHDARQWAILAALGLFGGLGQLFLTGSLRYAPVGAVVPFDYTQLLWAVLLGWAIWDRHAAATTWAGGAVIIASGIYTAWREQRLGRDKPRAEPL